AARGGEVSPSPLTGEGYGGLAAPPPGRSGVTFEEKEASSKARQLATRASCAILLPPWEKATDRRSARTGWPSVRPFCATAPVGWPARERRPSFALRAKPGAGEPVLDDHARRIALAQRDHIAVEADISRRQAIKVVVVAPLHCRAVVAHPAERGREDLARRMARARRPRVKRREPLGQERDQRDVQLGGDRRGAAMRHCALGEVLPVVRGIDDGHVLTVDAGEQALEEAAFRVFDRRLVLADRRAVRRD